MHLAGVHAADARQRDQACRAQFALSLGLWQAKGGSNIHLMAPLDQGADDVEGTRRATAADGHQLFKNDDQRFHLPSSP